MSNHITVKYLNFINYTAIEILLKQKSTGMFNGLHIFSAILKALISYLFVCTLVIKDCSQHNRLFMIRLIQSKVQNSEHCPVPTYSPKNLNVGTVT